MHVMYKPEDGDRQEWDFKPGRVRASEAQVIERQFGGNWDEFAAGVQQGNMKARTVLLWHLFRRDGHLALRYEDVPDFFADELEVEYSTDELTEARANIERSTTLPTDKKAAVLAAIDREMEGARAREAASAGKASSTTPPNDGGSSSPQSSTSLPGESAI